MNQNHEIHALLREGADLLGAASRRHETYVALRDSAHALTRISRACRKLPEGERMEAVAARLRELVEQLDVNLLPLDEAATLCLSAQPLLEEAAEMQERLRGTP